MTEPRWLDADEQRAWLSVVAVMLTLPAALDAQLQRDAGLTHFDYVVLASLSAAPERTMRMSDLAARASSSLSRLSHAVAKLEGRGWVRRQPHPTDGRATVAIMTHAGWAKIVETAPGHVETVRTLVFDALSESQVQQLRRINDRLLQRLDPDGRHRGIRPAT
jgi:DNA-binding MarR family transcriptional regulator